MPEVVDRVWGTECGLVSPDHKASMGKVVKNEAELMRHFRKSEALILYRSGLFQVVKSL